MRRVLECWTQAQGYLHAIAGGDFRYNLDNKPAGAITDKHQCHARRLLEEKEAGKGGG
jgi:sRNA-binding protein